MNARLPLRLALLAAFATIGLAGCDDYDAHAKTADSVTASRYVAMARGIVEVDGGTVSIYAPRDGRIAAVPATEGDLIKRGDVLAQMDAESANLAVEAAQADLAQAQAQLAVLRARQGAVERRADRLGHASAEGLASGQNADDAASQRDAQRAEIAASAAAVEQAQQKLKTAQWERTQRTIVAPVDGRVARRLVNVGSSVATQPPSELFVLIPQAPLVVRAELEQDYVDRVHPGMDAEVIDEVAPDKVYPATVRRLGDMFTRRNGDVTGNERQDVRVLDCLLTLKSSDVRIGQRVLVRFVR